MNFVPFRKEVRKAETFDRASFDCSINNQKSNSFAIALFTVRDRPLERLQMNSDLKIAKLFF
jgi:hypothetical protein